MRVVFWGTPASVVPYLDVIAEAHQLVGVVTQPDRPRGRGRKIKSSPVKQAAGERGVPVLQPESVKDTQFRAQLVELSADVFAVAAYGQILPRGVIQIPAKAAINVHYSLLPKLRGAAPVQHALLQGLTETGVSVQYISEELEAGDIIRQQGLVIEPDDDAATLTVRLTKLGTNLLGEALDLIEAGSAPRIAQDEGEATYAPALSREDGIIDWCQPAPQIVNQVRGCWPWPGAVCQAQERRLKIAKAAVVPAETYTEGECGVIVEILPEQGLVVRAAEQAVLIKEVQPAGRRIMSAPEYLRGAHVQIGDRLQ